MHPFESQLRHLWPSAADPTEHAMVAVSGGADSVALLAAINEIRVGKGLFAAHFNHRLRGAESDQHEAFV
ncbi:MAG: tRNA(Ile)-lysidine synthase, partial [Planctomycetota bacterium]